MSQWSEVLLRRKQCSEDSLYIYFNTEEPLHLHRQYQKLKQASEEDGIVSVD